MENIKKDLEIVNQLTKIYFTTNNVNVNVRLKYLKTMKDAQFYRNKLEQSVTDEKQKLLKLVEDEINVAITKGKSNFYIYKDISSIINYLENKDFTVNYIDDRDGYIYSISF